MTSLYFLEPEVPGAVWAPFADSSPISRLRAGGWTIQERWSRALGTNTKVAGVISPHLGVIPKISGPVWVVDSTFCPKLPTRAVAGAKRLLNRGRAVAWRLDPGENWDGQHNTGDGLVVDGLSLGSASDLVGALEKLLFDDTLIGLEAGTDELPPEVTVIGNSGAVAIRGAEVEPGVVLDVRKGAVILEKGVVVQSGTRIEGPTWLREHTVVAGGRLRNISAGPHCRLHGEISSTVFLGYANKSHDGFVGHSVVGMWANLGAGTTTSNLKNTYGPIRLQVDKTQLETGRTNLGALIGDHVKTAIGTLLPTGTVLGIGANLFGNPRSTKYVAPFGWGYDGETMAVDKFIEIAKRVMPRRDVAVDEKVEAELRAMHARTTGKG